MTDDTDSERDEPDPDLTDADGEHADSTPNWFGDREEAGEGNEVDSGWFDDIEYDEGTELPGGTPAAAESVENAEPEAASAGDAAGEPSDDEEPEAVAEPQTDPGDGVEAAGDAEQTGSTETSAASLEGTEFVPADATGDGETGGEPATDSDAARASNGDRTDATPAETGGPETGGTGAEEPTAAGQAEESDDRSTGPDSTKTDASASRGTAERTEASSAGTAESDGTSGSGGIIAWLKSLLGL